MDVFSEHTDALPTYFAANLERLECLTYGMYSMVSTILMMTAHNQHVLAKVGVQHNNMAVSGPCVPDLPETSTQTFANITSPSRSRRARAKKTRQRLWSSAQAPSLHKAPCNMAEHHEISCQTSIEGEQILHIEGEAFLLMSKVEELSRMTAARTVEEMQKSYDSRLEGTIAKVDAEQRRLKESIMNLEEELSRERARADMLAAELAQEGADHLEYAAHDWDDWDPWLFFDKDELAPMSQTCHDWKHMVEKHTPFFSITPAGGPAADG